MELVQTVTITLSNGATSVYYGRPIADAGDPSLTVTKVEFSQPRFVPNIKYQDMASPEVAAALRAAEGEDAD